MCVSVIAHGDDGAHAVVYTIATPDYSRSDWKHWIDADSDCQDTRQEILISQSEVPVTFETSRHCKVVSGKWVDPYSGLTYTDPSLLDVDHVVPLRHVHYAGGWRWDSATKEAYANDLHRGHLLAVYRSLNRSKGSRGPDEWKPPNKDMWCFYAHDWITVKKDWRLSISVSEMQALNEMLATCPIDSSP